MDSSSWRRIMTETRPFILPFLSICLLLLAGCPGVDTAVLNEALDSEQVLGGNDQRIVMARFDVTLPSSPLALYAALLSGESGEFMDSGDFVRVSYATVDP